MKRDEITWTSSMPPFCSSDRCHFRQPTLAPQGHENSDPHQSSSPDDHGEELWLHQRWRSNMRKLGSRPGEVRGGRLR